MQYLPLSTTDAHMTPLMVLVAIKPTQKVHLSVLVDAYLIDIADADAFTVETLSLPRGAC